MEASTLNPFLSTRALRRAARLAGLFVLAVVALFARGGGEAPPDPLRQAPLDGVLVGLLVPALVGLVLAWKWESIDGAVSRLSLLLFVIHEIAARARPSGRAFKVMAVPGLLSLASWWAHSHRPAAT
jgi:hypothetical protein